MKKVLLSKSVESSVYSFDSISEDFRLAQVHRIFCELELNDSVFIDDHRLLSLPTNEHVNRHATNICNEEYEVIVQFIRQPSSSVDFTRRWLQILRREYSSQNKRYPLVFIAGDVTVGYSTFFERDLITAVLLGDEDDVVASIISIIEGGNLEDLPRAIIKSKSLGYIKKFDSKKERNINSLPHGTLYALNSQAVKEGKINYLPHIRATRGCYANCSFCHESVTEWNANFRHVHVSIKWLEDEVERLYVAGVREIVFQDSNFLPRKIGNDIWVSDFIEMMNGKFPEMKYSFWTRAEDIDEERMKKLSTTKLLSVLIGVESLSDERLRFFRKGLKVEHIENAIKLLYQYRIEGKFSFILFQPDLSYSQMNAELNAISKLFERYPGVQRNPLFAYNLLIPHPDTDLQEKYKSDNYLSKNPVYNFEEHFTFMSGKKVGDHNFLPNFKDPKLALLCEAFRLFQYEYSKKWFAVIKMTRENTNENYSSFFINLPNRMISSMITMYNSLADTQLSDINQNAQTRITDLLYSLVLDDYNRFLPVEARNLETPHSINYSKHWKNVISV